MVGNSLVVGDLEGYVHLLARNDGRILGRQRVAKGGIQAQPLVAGGRVFVLGADGTLAALSLGAVSPATTKSPTPMPTATKTPTPAF